MLSIVDIPHQTISSLKERFMDCSSIFLKKQRANKANKKQTSMLYAEEKWLISLFLFLQINTIFSNAFNILCAVSNIYVEAKLELMRCKERRAWPLTVDSKLHFTVSIIFNGR